MNKFEEEGLREMVKINQETGQYDMNEAIKKIQQIEEAHKRAEDSKSRFGPEKKEMKTFEQHWETNGVNVYPSKELAQEAWEAGYRQGQHDSAMALAKGLEGKPFNTSESELSGLVMLLRQARDELRRLIDEDNARIKATITSHTESEPDYRDYQTCHELHEAAKRLAA